jgi:hypothetical protein
MHMVGWHPEPMHCALYIDVILGPGPPTVEFVSGFIVQTKVCPGHFRVGSINFHCTSLDMVSLPS